MAGEQSAGRSHVSDTVTRKGLVLLPPADQVPKVFSGGLVPQQLELCSERVAVRPTPFEWKRRSFLSRMRVILRKHQ